MSSIIERQNDAKSHRCSDALTFLLEEGYIYNTIDETHVACTI